MQEQQNIEFYTKRTQDKDKINLKSLESVLNLDNEGFIKFLEDQSELSKIIILDTSMFMPLSLGFVIEFIDHDQRNDIKEYIERVFLKTQENLSYLNSALINNKGFVITNEVTRELYDWNIFWKRWINPEDPMTISKGLLLKKDKEYIAEVLKRNKPLHSLLKEHTRYYISRVIDIRNFLINEKRVLSSSDLIHRNDDFKTLLKKVVWNTNNKKGKVISEEDKRITYALFLNALNCPTGLMSMDSDFDILTRSVHKNLFGLNKTLKKYDLYIKSNDYNEKFFTYLIHVDHL